MSDKRDIFDVLEDEIAFQVAAGAGTKVASIDIDTETRMRMLNSPKRPDSFRAPTEEEKGNWNGIPLYLAEEDEPVGPDGMCIWMVTWRHPSGAHEE